MANHYSGKRAAGRKPLGKRALSLLMALVMSLSLVQITAFAANDTAADKTQVVEAGGVAYYDKNGMKLEPATGSGEPENWVVKVERTLKETGTENLLDVDLKVTTKDNTVVTDAEAAAVLVIDTSGSMGYCAGCGAKNKDEHEKAAGEWVYKCKDKSGNVWEDANGDDICDHCGKYWWERDRKGWKETHSREWVTETTHDFVTRISAAKEAANSFLDSFAKNANGQTATAPRYVSIVTFATVANSRKIVNEYWVDVTDANSLSAAKKTIAALEANGGTNTEAGIQLATNLLTQKSTVANRFVVMLTDGKPTYYIDGGDRSNLDKVPQNSWQVAGEGNKTTKKETAPVETVSQNLVSTGAKIYSVVYGLTDSETGEVQTVPDSQGVDTAMDTWMVKNCKMSGVYPADSVDALNAAFRTILNTIKKESVGTTVVTAVNNMIGEDDLKDVYSFVQFNDDANGAVAKGNSVEWDLGDATAVDGTYHLSYRVWMGTETSGFQAGKAYSLGEATLSYKMTGDESAKTAEFPKISAKGYLADLSFTKVDDENAPLSGATFELLSVPTYTETSDENGKVEFSNIASGYTYTLSETKAPEGYVKTDKTWSVSVDYGKVTVTENNGTLNPFDPADGNFQVVNTPAEPEPPKENEYTATVKYYYSDTGIDGPYTYDDDADETITVKATALPTSCRIPDKSNNGTYTFNGSYTADAKAVSGLEQRLNEDGQEFHVYYYKDATPEPTLDAISLRKHATNLDSNFITNITLSIRPEEFQWPSAQALTAEDDYNHNYTAYVAAGSYVEDYMGYVAGDGGYNFDFVNDANEISLEYGETRLPAVKLDVDSAEYTYYTFGSFNDESEEPSAQAVDDAAVNDEGADDENITGEYPFVLRYRAANDGTEMFTLFINVVDGLQKELKLHYAEKLMNPVTENDTYDDITYGEYHGQGVPGIYSIRNVPDDGSLYTNSLYTNNEAALRVYDENWVDDDGNSAPTWIRYFFPMPTVSYTVKGQERPTPPPVTPRDTYYTVTVNYYDKDSGEVIHTAYTTTQREYTAYDVTAQDKVAITGYTYVETTGDALTGTLNGNKVINVYYTKDSNIDDGNTPTDPGTDIGDDDVPVTPAQPPKTGDSMGLWIAAAMVSGMGLIWLSLSGKKRKEEI